MKPHRQISQIFRGIHGYVDLSEREEAHLRLIKSSSTYGEITNIAAQKLIDYIGLGPDDVFYDLGSGVGKLVIQTAMCSPAKKIVGIEFSRQRIKMARMGLAEAKAQDLLECSQVKFVCSDLMRRNLNDATVIYSCSTAFPPRFFRKMVKKLEGMRSGFVFISLSEIKNNPYFDLIDTLRLNMSWLPNTPVYVYERVDPFN
ncbi:MAG: hypothetical protein OEZ43_17885 [Gammaproteobacteria bacterium]|nr:hypothetical protein [Gammaproteobacteria bacterium]